MRIAILLLSFTLLFPSFASALSDKDSSILAETSAAFDEAEKNLKKAWENFVAVATETEYNKVRKEYREWRKKHRDADAAALMKNSKLSKADAYAQTAKEQAEKLNEYTQKSTATVNHKDITGTYSSRNGEVAISKKDQGYAVKLHTYKKHGKQTVWECIYDEEIAVPLQGNVLTFAGKDGKDPVTVTIAPNNSAILVENIMKADICKPKGKANGAFRR